MPVRLVRDTAMLRRWHIRADWKPASAYKLTIPAGTVTDIAGFSNDSLVGNYTTLDPDKFATVKIQVKARDPQKRYLIQLLNGSSLQQEKRDVTAGPVQFNYVPAGEIKFRVIEDTNGNGRWDTGNVVERRQPERAEFYLNDKGEDSFATKVNWEIEFAMDMDALFAPMNMETLQRRLDEQELQRLRREAERNAKEGPKRDSDRNGSDNRSTGSFNATGGMFDRFR